MKINDLNQGFRIGSNNVTESASEATKFAANTALSQLEAVKIGRLPFSPAELTTVGNAQFSGIKDALRHLPTELLTPVKTTSLRPSNDLLAGAGEIDKLMDEARATLSDPNAKFEDKLAAQQKMSTAMTLFQFFSAIIKQFSDMANTVNSALR